MNYKKFQKMLAARVQELLANKATVVLHRLPRNNGVWKDSLDIRAPGASLVPSIHMDYFYQEYLKGVSVEHLAELILDEYQQFKEKRWVPMGFFNSYRTVRENVYCKVINYEKNKRLLATTPHRRWCDLAFVYYYRVPAEYCKDAAVLIRKNHLESWGVQEEELEKDAWRNTTEKMPPKLEKLSDLLKEWGELEQMPAQMPERTSEQMPEKTLERTSEQTMGQAMGQTPEQMPEQTQESASEQERKQDKEDKEEDKIFPETSLYLLTNQDKCLGANCIFYPGQAERIGEMLEADFYVLPSSIHECLLLAADQANGAKLLQKMVEEINRTQVEPQEVLSDHVYYYSRALHRLDICP